MKMRIGIATLGLLLTFCVLVPSRTHAQKRDYFTAEEIELIRDAQQIDHRIGVLVTAVDRRFAALKIDVAAGKIKDQDKWGPQPVGTRAELLYDIKNILQKAIDDVDNLSSRPDSMVIAPDDKNKKPKGFSDLFPVAVRSLAKAAERYKGPLTTSLNTTKDEREKGLILDSLDMCEDIIASVSKLSATPEKPQKDH